MEVSRDRAVALVQRIMDADYASEEEVGQLAGPARQGPGASS